LMCCILVGFTAASHAQGMNRTPEARAKALQTQLSLTDDQTAKITAIYTAQAPKMDSLRTAANGDRDAMMKGMLPLMMATNDKIKAVLTADQAAAFDKMMKERMDRMRGAGN
jgi:protein CpxP